MRYAFLLIFGMILTHASLAGAQLAPRFHTPGTDVRQKQVIAFLIEKGEIDPAKPLLISEADLNGDGVLEWIIRQDGDENCAARADCSFRLAGLQSRKPVFLGGMQASKIEILEKTEYGVNTIGVYNNPNNDFTPQVFEWKPNIRLFGPF